MDDTEYPFDRDYNKPMLFCGNWVAYARNRREGVVIETANSMTTTADLITNAYPNDDVFLFVCLSSPYTPAEDDGKLFQLLRSLPCAVDFNLTR